MPQSPAQQYMILALFVILLAFFVFLNTLTRLDTGKAGAVAQSLEDALALPLSPSEEGAEAEGPPLPTGVGGGQDKGRGDVPQRLEALEAVFRAQVPGLGPAERSHGGTQMRLEGDAVFFEGALARAAREQESPLGRLLTVLLASGADGPALEITLTLGTGSPPAVLRPEAARGAALRVAAMARGLEALGLEEGFVLAGLDSRPAGRLEITLRPAEERAP